MISHDGRRVLYSSPPQFVLLTAVEKSHMLLRGSSAMATTCRLGKVDPRNVDPDGDYDLISEAIEITVHGDYVSEASFLNRSNHLLLVRGFHTVAVWDIDTRREIARLPLFDPLPPFGVRSVVTNDDCSLLAVALPCNDGSTESDYCSIQLWEGFDGPYPLRTVTLPFCPLRMSFTSDGERMCFLSDDNAREREVVVMCLKTGRALQTLQLPCWVTHVVDVDQGCYYSWENPSGPGLASRLFRLWMYETAVIVHG